MLINMTFSVNNYTKCGKKRLKRMILFFSNILFSKKTLYIS